MLNTMAKRILGMWTEDRLKGIQSIVKSVVALRVYGDLITQ
ncbi:hypothetical protein ES703_109511 [subsurface metagenome]